MQRQTELTDRELIAAYEACASSPTVTDLAKWLGLSRQGLHYRVQKARARLAEADAKPAEDES